ncbi:Shugoshin-like protein [Elsinoe fawcettii]|nr:Shugoshin-like protein [Elsinoe fawcettii]
MARLNEAPLQTESVDALKRRFIRQNRDLARINTHQSLRIRALEIDQSRLQTENLALREEIIRLQNQLTDCPGNLQLSDIDNVRRELQRKLEEILGVVSDLGQFKKQERPKRQSDPSLWKPAFPTLRLAGTELRMPAIVEGKQYPRQTLDAQEIRALRLSDQSTESPDLGPPPVAHFEYVDPIKFDRPNPLRRQSGGDEEVEEIPADMAINLETRRRRKDGPAKTTMTATEDLPVDPPARKAAPVRTSTKRKLSVCETEEPSTSHSSEPFSFTRLSSSSGELRRSASNEAVTSSPTKLDMTEWINSDAPRERKVLGDKSVNQSPRKVLTGKNSSAGLNKAAAPESVDVPKVRARRPKAPSTLPVPVQVQPDPIETATASIDLPDPTEAEPLPPKTPSLDLFSPTSAPSSSRPASALTTANSEGMEGTTRPSRRARAAVSYAEPSLNTKMRRPTKELVDAVAMSRASISASKRPSSAPLMKNEDEEADWRKLPAATVAARSPSLPSRDEGRELPESRIASPPASTRALATRLGRIERPRSVAEIRLSGGRDLSSEVKEKTLDDCGDVSERHRRTSSLEVRRTRRHSSISGLGEVELGSSSPRLSSLDTSPAEAERMEGRPGIGRSTSQPLGLTGRSERLASRRRSMIV